jgi:hypothetical protein
MINLFIFHSLKYKFSPEKLDFENPHFFFGFSPAKYKQNVALSTVLRYYRAIRLKSGRRRFGMPTFALTRAVLKGRCKMDYTEENIKYIRNINTLQEYYNVLKRLIDPMEQPFEDKAAIEGECAITHKDRENAHKVRDALELTALEICKANPTLDLPEPPLGRNVTLSERMSWCIKALRVTDVAAMLKANPASLKPAEIKQDTTDAKEGKDNVNVNIYGDVKAGNLQIAHDASIHKRSITAEKKKGILIRLLKIIGAIVGFLAALLGILNYLGWLEPIKAFIHNISWPK